ARAHLFGKELRLFPGSKVPAFVELIVVDQFWIRPLRPTARAQIDLVRKGAYGNRDGNAFDTEIREFAFPVESGTGNRRVRQPGDRDVVEDIVPGEAGSFSGKEARDQRVAPRIVIQKIGGQADGGVRNSVQRLRPQPHLVAVGDAFAVDECHR